MHQLNNIFNHVCLFLFQFNVLSQQRHMLIFTFQTQFHIKPLHFLIILYFQIQKLKIIYSQNCQKELQQYQQNKIFNNQFILFNSKSSSYNQFMGTNEQCLGASKLWIVLIYTLFVKFPLFLFALLFIFQILLTFPQYSQSSNFYVNIYNQVNYSSQSNIKRQILMGRTAVFILSFLTYATVHMMRTTYSFNKQKFQEIFGIGDLFLGFVDAFIYLTLAVGTFMRYSILNSRKPVQSCLFTAIPTIIGFSIIPIISLFKEDEFQQIGSVWDHILIAGSFGVFGFFQLSFFPATLTIFSNQFNVKNDGKLVGIWSSKSNAGNIMGFLMSNLFVYQFQIRWQYTMIVCSVMLLIVCLLLYKFVQNPPFKSGKKITTKKFFRFFFKTWSKTQFKLYIMSFSFFKAILYSYELWTPKFLADNGFKDYSGYVPMLFDIFTLFGSFFMGYIYQKQSKRDENSTQEVSFLSKYKFFIPALLVIIICVCYILVPGSLTVYFILGASMGLFLGAIYNSLQNNQIMNYTDNKPDKTDMFSTINIGIGCAMVGVSQFIIGLVLNISEKGQQQQDQSTQRGSIYIVIAVIAVIAAIITFIRSLHQKKPQSMGEIDDKSDISASILTVAD